MKIKAILAAIIISTTVVPAAHSFGLGVQANFRAGGVFAPGASLLISPTDITHLAINWYIDLDNVNTVGLTLDLAPLCLPITSSRAASFNFTLGIGLYTNMVFTNDRGVNGGLRIPIGLNILLGPRVLEFFAHVAPSFGVHFLPSMGLSYPFYPIALGARLWIR
jgi:hypothetical protein